jgi:gamma-glutamylcyclotransferase (GGCT)/AIG2-like uncharacterized protein YtfP
VSDGFFHLFAYGTLAGSRGDGHGGAGHGGGASSTQSQTGSGAHSHSHGHSGGGGGAHSHAHSGGGAHSHSHAHSGGGAGERLMRGCVKVGEGHVKGTLYDLGDFPALMLAGSQRVRGEIWRCPAERLQELDRYEGVEEGLFRRVGVRVGETACWVYVAGPRLGARLTRRSG